MRSIIQEDLNGIKGICVLLLVYIDDNNNDDGKIRFFVEKFVEKC